MNTIARPTLRKPMAGLTLVELMVAMTIGLMLLSGISYLFLGARQTFRTTESLSRIQENARYALEVMARDIRMAGHLGCGNLQNIPVNTIANPPAPDFSTLGVLTGLDSPTADEIDFRGSGVTRVAGDSISLMAVFDEGVKLVGNLMPQNANIQIEDNRYGFQANDVLLVTNCISADMFRATNVSSSGGSVTIAHSNSSNTGNRIGRYLAGSDTRVSRVEQRTYFIGLNPAGRRSLYSLSLTQGVRELVEGVWDMKIRYGVVDPALSNRAVSQYQTAGQVSGPPSRWEGVLSVQLELLLVSAEDGIVAERQQFDFNRDTVIAGDRRMYQVFTSTIGVRNRLP